MGFRFFVHDAEWTLMDENVSRLGPFPAGDSYGESNPQWIHQQLMYNARYRRLFADRAYSLLANGGALTEESMFERVNARRQQIETAIIAESARWGDTHRSIPLTKADWETEVDHILNTFIPKRTEVLIEQLKNAIPFPLLPNIDPPEFSQHGGEVSSGFHLELETNGHDIYYTTDGTDPILGSPIVEQISVLSPLSEAKYVIPSDGSG